MAEMARMFLGRNRSTPVTAFERFGVAVTAGYPAERAITEIVEDVGLKIGYPGTEGNVYSVGALRRVYDRYGAKTLERVLRVLRDAYNKQPGRLGPATDRRPRTRPRHVCANRREGAGRGAQQGTTRGARAAAPRRAVPRAPRTPGTRVRRSWGGRHLQPPRWTQAKPREVVESPRGWPPAPPQRGPAREGPERPGAPNPALERGGRG